MEAITRKLPDTLEEDELLAGAATWEEYISLTQDAPFTIQFLNGELIRSQATDVHEALVIRIGAMLLAYFDTFDDNYRVLGSNIKIVAVDKQIDFNADISVVKQPIDYGTTPTGNPSRAQIKNPEIVVEILSNSTRKFDMGEKLSYYKLIPSLQHILLVDQTRPFATVYSRTGTPDEWLNHDYRTLNSVVRLGALELPMEAIYRKTVFTT